MKCIFCAAPLPKQGLTCNYCKKINPLNHTLLSTGEVEASINLCPICHISLNTLKASDHQIECCFECDGILMNEEEFEVFIEQYIDPLILLSPNYLQFIQNNPRDNRKKSKFHNCPVCNEQMNVINYKKNSGVLLDICEEHGIWFDGGELRQIIDWYEVGGDQKNK